jgi:hypothetical protein
MGSGAAAGSCARGSSDDEDISAGAASAIDDGFALDARKKISHAPSRCGRTTPHTTKKMDELRDLSLRLGPPSPQALWVAAQRNGIPLTRAQVFDFAARRAAPQIFREHNQPQGKTAAEGTNVRWQTDLAMMPPRRGAIGFLLVVDVFTRRAYAKPVRSKEPYVLRSALQAVMREVRGRYPASVLTDRGAEFRTAFTDELERAGIVHLGKHVADRNGLAVVDRAMQTLKRDLAVRNAQAPGDWIDRLPSAVRAYNERYHGTVHDAPDDVAAGGIPYFLTLQDNARKFAHNQEVTNRRIVRLHEAGNFRPPIVGQAFAGPRRVAEPRFGPVESAANATVPRGRGTIRLPDGRQVLLKALQPVRLPAEV